MSCAGLGSIARATSGGRGRRSRPAERRSDPAPAFGWRGASRVSRSGRFGADVAPDGRGGDDRLLHPHASSAASQTGRPATCALEIVQHGFRRIGGHRGGGGFEVANRHRPRGRPTALSLSACVGVLRQHEVEAAEQMRRDHAREKRFATHAHRPGRHPGIQAAPSGCRSRRVSSDQIGPEFRFDPERQIRAANDRGKRATDGGMVERQDTDESARAGSRSARISGRSDRAGRDQDMRIRAAARAGGRSIGKQRQRFADARGMQPRSAVPAGRGRSGAAPAFVASLARSSLPRRGHGAPGPD